MKAPSHLGLAAVFVCSVSSTLLFCYAEFGYHPRFMGGVGYALAGLAGTLLTLLCLWWRSIKRGWRPGASRLAFWTAQVAVVCALASLLVFFTGGAEYVFVLFGANVLFGLLLLVPGAHNDEPFALRALTAAAQLLLGLWVPWAVLR